MTRFEQKNAGVFTREIDDLSNSLLESYAPHLAPRFPVSLQLGISYICALFSPSTGILKSVVWETYTWKDERLEWSPSNYSDIRSIKLPASKIWRPDIRIYNGIQPSERDSDLSVVIGNTGDITWVSPAVHYTFCSSVPVIDDQRAEAFNCRLKFGSWTHNGLEIDIDNAGVVDQSQYNIENCAVMSNVTFTKNVKYYECCPEPYVDVLVNFTIEGNPNLKCDGVRVCVHYYKTAVLLLIVVSSIFH